MPTRLHRTNGTPTLGTKCTISVWLKRTDTAINASSRDAIIAEAYSSANDYCWVRFDGDDKINIYGVISSSAFASITTTRKFRDPNSWYHIVVALDSTESTSTDRIKVYINGVRETNFSGSTYPSSEVGFNKSGWTFNIGDSLKQTSNFYFDGTLSHYNFIDGVALTPSTFGSTDSTTGIWKISPTAYNGTYGTNGFFLFKDNGSLTDQSGNSNNFTLASGTCLNTQDNPSNNFTKWNYLNMTNSPHSRFYGSHTKFASGTNWLGTVNDRLLDSGKWYWEFYYGSGNGGQGVARADTSAVDTTNMSTANSGYSGKYSDGYLWFRNGAAIYTINNSAAVTSASSLGNVDFTTGDYGMMAFDVGAGHFWLGKNGTWLKGATSSEIAAGTTTNSTMNVGSSATGWFVSGTAENGNASTNFGQGFFETTQITGTTYTDSNNFGVFKYQPPTNFLAICDRNLNA